MNSSFNTAVQDLEASLKGIFQNSGKGSSTVQSFMTQFKRGYGRPDRFRVQFNLPPGVGVNLGFVDTRAQSSQIMASQQTFNSGQGAVNLMCNQASFPQRSLLTWEQNQNSAPFKTPYSYEYDPVTFSFYADSTLNTRQYFEIWQAAAANIQNNTMNYMSEFVTLLTVFQMDSAGNDTYAVALIDAWPITVGSTEVSMSSANSIHNVTVTMAYRFYVPVTNSKAAQAAQKSGTSTSVNPAGVAHSQLSPAFPTK